MSLEKCRADLDSFPFPDLYGVGICSHSAPEKHHSFKSEWQIRAKAISQIHHPLGKPKARLEITGSVESDRHHGRSHACHWLEKSKGQYLCMGCNSFPVWKPAGPSGQCLLGRVTAFVTDVSQHFLKQNHSLPSRT